MKARAVEMHKLASAETGILMQNLRGRSILKVILSENFIVLTLTSKLLVSW